jgi:hypothetical protein
MNKTSITSQLNRLDSERLRNYRELLDFYHGRQWLGRERWGEKRLTFNYTKVFIDKITSYLMSGISFVVEAEEDSAEASSGQAFILESYEHISAGAKASLVLYAADGWSLIENWRARHQFRWNKASQEMNVKEILAFVLARVGLKLEVKSASSALTNDYPDFTINPTSSGDSVIQRLLSFVPDVLFIEGNTAYVVNPSADDASDYSYGSAHAIFAGKYKASAWGINRLLVEGYDSTEGEAIVVDAFAWEEIDRLYDRIGRIEDRNIESVAGAEGRAEAYMRGVEMAAVNGAILVPVNCGQQLYDVVDITDSRAGLSAAKRRVNGLTLVYSPRRGEYRQRLLLGGV